MNQRYQSAERKILMRTSKTKNFFFAVLLLTAGCASAPAWWRVDGPYERDTYAVQLPSDWKMPSRLSYLLLTKDGVNLQNITIDRSHVDTPFSFTKKKFSPGMLSQEAAEIFLDNLASNEIITNFEVLENKPIKLSGHNSFRAVYTFKDKDKLKYRVVTYGFVREKTFYDLSYIAPVRHYFDKDIKTFEKLVQSFKLVAPEREVKKPANETEDQNQDRGVLQGGGDTN